MTLRRSTKIWLLAFGVSALVFAMTKSLRVDTGCTGIFLESIAILSCLVLVFRTARVLFRAVFHRTALRLAFSYILIGIVPIPLILALLAGFAYLVANRIIATRLRREIAAAAEVAAAQPGVPELRLQEARVVSSDVPWIHSGDEASWARTLDSPRPILEGKRIWFAVPGPEPDRVRLVLVNDPSSDLLQNVADRSGYEIRITSGRSGAKSRGTHLEIDKGSAEALGRPFRPRGAPPSQDSWWTRQWLFGASLEAPLASGASGASAPLVVLLIGRTSPRVLYDQVFEQGASKIGRLFWAVLTGLGAALLFVYLVALAIAFVLSGSIARNVNRLSRATAEIAGGNFSVRVRSKSHDQIGDLARSFDAMAASMESLLAETAEKKRLEAEIATARTIQQKLLPPAEASFPGLHLLAHFQPVAAIGGDYYDYLPMPDGRTAVAIGDVSGHGLPTGLLAAMAKAALTTQIESGLTGTALFSRLNDLIHRSTDARNYMTLSLIAYDAASRRADLTNAGHLGPYRLSAGSVESLALASFPLGVSKRDDFPTRTHSLTAGDRLVLLTDGLVEAASSSGEPFSFERLEALLKEEAASSAERIREVLLAALAAHTGSAPPDDDRTLVILTVV